MDSLKQKRTMQTLPPSDRMEQNMNTTNNSPKYVFQYTKKYFYSKSNKTTIPCTYNV